MEWWTNQSAGYVGAAIGILGAVMGISAAILGTLINRGRGRLALTVFSCFISIVGAGGIIATIIALCLTQPYHVWYPLALAGMIFSSCGFFVLRPLYMRLHAAEQRRLDAEHLRRS